jgi:glycosyltransferase involved in cell wall biosynthesis
MPVSVAFVLASWKPDAHAGMERATAAAAAGLVTAGHRAVIITAAGQAGASFAGATVERLTTVSVRFPCADHVLRSAIDRAGDLLCHELLSLYMRHRVDAAVYVDALWGLGRVMPASRPTHRLLALHVLGHDTDLAPALQRCTSVLTPSTVVPDAAAQVGYDTTGWHVIPNTLLADPPEPDTDRRARLRIDAPIRVLARLGPEKGVAELLAAGGTLPRRVDVAVGCAAFEHADGSQRRVLADCQQRADRHPRVHLRRGMPWDQVPGWLADAGVVIVPSLRETFGLVALEAMAAGTPVVAYTIGNLPLLIGDGGVLVPPGCGAGALWRAAEDLLADPVRYATTSRAAYYRSRDFRPALVADQLLKVVS